LPFGDHAGEMIGWPLLSATWPFSPSASATRSVWREPGARDVGDAGREHALLAGQLLVDEVGDAVRRQAQVAGLDGAALAAELAALDDVPELEADVVAAVGEAAHRAADERVGRARAPLRHLRARALVEARRLRVDDAEGAAPLEVGADDGRDRLRGLVLVAEPDDGDRQLGRADAGDLDPELRRRGQRGERSRPAQTLRRAK
jgi:hypothetical protein